MKPDDRSYIIACQNYSHSCKMAGDIRRLYQNPAGGTPESKSNCFLSLEEKRVEKDEQLLYGDDIHCSTSIGQELTDIEMKEDKRILKKDVLKCISKKFRGLACKSGDLVYGLLHPQFLYILFQHAMFCDSQSDCLLSYTLKQLAISASGKSGKESSMLEQFYQVVKYLEEIPFVYIDQDKDRRLKDRYASELSPKCSDIREDESFVSNVIRADGELTQRMSGKQNAGIARKKKASNEKKEKGDSGLNKYTKTRRDWDDNTKAKGKGQTKKCKNKNLSTGLVSGSVDEMLLFLQLSLQAARFGVNEAMSYPPTGISSNEYDYDDKFITRQIEEIAPTMSTTGPKEHESLAALGIYTDIAESVPSPEHGAMIHEIKDDIRRTIRLLTPITAEGSFEDISEEPALQHSHDDRLKIPRVVVEKSQTDAHDIGSVQETTGGDCGTCAFFISPDEPSFNGLHLRLSANDEVPSPVSEHHSSPTSPVHTTESGNEPGVSHETLLARMENQDITLLPACTTSREASSNSGTASLTSSEPGPVERKTHSVQVTTDHASSEARFLNQYSQGAYHLPHVAGNRAYHPEEENNSELCSSQHSAAARQASCFFGGRLDSRNGSDQTPSQTHPEPFEVDLSQSPVSRFLSEREQGQQVVVHCAGSIPPWATRTPQIDLSRAASAQHIPLRNRRATYIRWPRKETGQEPASMALAGYFYTGEGTTVRCFYCGVQISDWRSSMNPWHEHIRGQPACQYLVKMKGEDFVREIQKEQSSEK